MKKDSRSRGAFHTAVRILLCAAALTLSACTGTKSDTTPSPAPTVSAAPASPSPTAAANPVGTPKPTETLQVTLPPAVVTPGPTAAPTPSVKPTAAPMPTVKPTAAPTPSANPAAATAKSAQPSEMHVHTVVTDPAVEATCKSTGLTEGTHCSTCGAVLTARQVTPLADHYYLFGQCIWCGERQKDWHPQQTETMNEPAWEESGIVLWDDGSIELPPLPIQ